MNLALYYTIASAKSAQLIENLIHASNFVRMSRKLDLGTIFDSISKMMQIDFQEIREVVDHPVEKGLTSRFRRLLIRWEKKVENYIGMLHFACAWITYRNGGLFR